LCAHSLTTDVLSLALSRALSPATTSILQKNIRAILPLCHPLLLPTLLWFRYEVYSDKGKCQGKRCIEQARGGYLSRDGCDSQVMSFSLGVDPSELLLSVRRRWPWGTRRYVRGTVLPRHARLRWQWRLPWCRPIRRANGSPFKLAQRSIQSSAFSIAQFVLERKSRPQKGIKLIRPCLGCVLRCVLCVS
jgi:hypothetical protein